MRRPMLADVDPVEREAFLALVLGVAFVECDSGWVVHMPGGGLLRLRQLAIAQVGWDGVLRLSPDA